MRFRLPMPVKTLGTLAEDRTTCSEKVFTRCCVMVEAPRVRPPFKFIFGSDLDVMPIEPMVLVEPRGLRCDYSVLEDGRDLAERNEFVAFVIGSMVNPGLLAALNVHCG